MRMIVALCAFVALSTALSTASAATPTPAGEQGKRCEDSKVSPKAGVEIEGTPRKNVPGANTDAGKATINEKAEQLVVDAAEKKKFLGQEQAEKQAKDELIKQKKLCVDDGKECKNGGKLEYKDPAGKSILLCADACNKTACEKGQKALKDARKKAGNQTFTTYDDFGNSTGLELTNVPKIPSAEAVGQQALQNAFDESKRLSGDGAPSKAAESEILARRAAIERLEAMTGPEAVDPISGAVTPNSLALDRLAEKQAALEAKAEPNSLPASASARPQPSNLQDAASTFADPSKYSAEAVNKASNLWELAKAAGGNFASYAERKSWVNSFAGWLFSPGEVYSGTAVQNSRLFRAIRGYLGGGI